MHSFSPSSGVAVCICGHPTCDLDIIHDIADVRGVPCDSDKLGLSVPF